MPSSLRDLLTRPPWALPAWLDAVSERWWRTGARTRVVLVAVAVTAVLLLATGSVVAGPYGPPTTVHVATRDLPLGHRLVPGDFEATTWPAELRPTSAAHDPEGFVAAPLPRGAVITDGHLHDGGLAAALPGGRVAVAVPREALPSLPTGTWLDLVAADLDGRARTVATQAVVVRVDAETLWLAVATADAPQTAAAGLTASLGAVVTAPPAARTDEDADARR